MKVYTPLSLPSRERGLKYSWIILIGEHHGSLPSRERGLKFNEFVEQLALDLVAPLAGAWIEIV